MISAKDVSRYLAAQKDFISYVEIAAALETGIPTVKKLLEKLSDRLESDGDGNYRLLPQAIASKALSSELSYDEARELLQLERKVERAFYEAGKALAEIRDRELYRTTHDKFESYCQDRFGFTRRAADYLISGSQVVDNLRTIGSQIELTFVLPTSERQVRPLAKLSPGEQYEVWTSAVEQANGRVPTALMVEKIAREKTMENSVIYVVPHQYSVGDPVRFVSSADVLKEHRGKWGIVHEVFEFSVSVRLFDRILDNILPGEIDVPECDLKIAKEVLASLSSLFDRVQDDGATSFCNRIAKKKILALTLFEEKTLEFWHSEPRA